MTNVGREDRERLPMKSGGNRTGPFAFRQLGVTETEANG
jgi:hypothetical protein